MSSPEVPLAALAKRAQGGDEGACAELLRALYPFVRKQIHFLLGGGASADDAVQETMIALYRGLPKFRGEASPRTWAATIAVRTARHLRRKDARYVPTDLEDELAIFDTDQTGAAELALLRRALAELSPKKREAFVMMGILEMTAEEAGRALGTFANTAASRHRHACAELEKVLTRTPGSSPRRVGEP